MQQDMSYVTICRNRNNIAVKCCIIKNDTEIIRRTCVEFKIPSL